ncbi:hypothetical protein JKP88DRAFT_294563 [Tribonema minus]|uniref:Uncharacterized protein n=1 Tax=Tribonema minus TaxID=303371 RepID=A0A835ZGL2_9STRA|nr:hypothetical protein JKP88DRAFT_294563 [Tribonema minus]
MQQRERNQGAEPVEDAQLCTLCSGITIFTHHLRNRGQPPLCLGFSRSQLGRVDIEADEEVLDKDQDFVKLAVGTRNPNANENGTRATAGGAHVVTHDFAAAAAAAAAGAGSRQAELGPDRPVSPQQHTHTQQQRRQRQQEEPWPDALAAFAQQQRQQQQQEEPWPDTLAAFAVKSGDAMQKQAKAMGSFWSRALPNFTPNFKSFAHENLELAKVLPGKSFGFAKKWAKHALDDPDLTGRDP